MQIDTALSLLRSGGPEGPLAPHLAAHVSAVVEVGPRHFLQRKELEVLLYALFFLITIGNTFQSLGAAHGSLRDLDFLISATTLRAFTFVEGSSADIFAGGYFDGTRWAYLVLPSHPQCLVAGDRWSWVIRAQFVADCVHQQCLIIEYWPIIDQEFVIPHNMDKVCVQEQVPCEQWCLSCAQKSSSPSTAWSENSKASILVLTKANAVLQSQRKWNIKYMVAISAASSSFSEQIRAQSSSSRAYSTFRNPVSSSPKEGNLTSQLFLERR